MWMGLIQSIEDLKMNNEAFQRKYSLSNSNINSCLSFQSVTCFRPLSPPSQSQLLKINPSVIYITLAMSHLFQVENFRSLRSILSKASISGTSNVASAFLLDDCLSFSIFP
jgi:hypothetical protein